MLGVLFCLFCRECFLLMSQSDRSFSAPAPVGVLQILVSRKKPMHSAFLNQHLSNQGSVFMFQNMYILSSQTYGASPYLGKIAALAGLPSELQQWSTAATQRVKAPQWQNTSQPLFWSRFVQTCYCNELTKDDWKAFKAKSQVLL